MIHITRNYKFNTGDNRAFGIYSDSTCEQLEYTCDYNQMIEVMQDNIDEMVNDGLIDYQQAWNMRNDYSLYNEAVAFFESEGY